MKNNKKIKQITNFKKLSFAIICALGLMNKANATDISTYIPAAKSSEYVEKQANLWFVLDDSGSMDLVRNETIDTGKTKKVRYRVCVSRSRWTNRCYRYGWREYDEPIYEEQNKIVIGYIPYNDKLEYKRPKRINGDPMPVPESGTKMWRDPFVSDAQGKDKSGFAYYDKLYTGSGEQITCEKDDDNCINWANFYRTRMLTLKSSLSLVLFDKKNEKIQKNMEQLRIGYRSLHNSSLISEHALPVLPLYGNNAEVNKLKFHKWLYGLSAGGLTPLRGVASKLIHDIVEASDTRGRVSSNNPFLDIPGKQYNKKTNKIFSCRRNYSIFLTDGGWNKSTEPEVTGNMSNPAYIKRKSLNENESLPQSKNGKGYEYVPRVPYKYVMHGQKGIQTLADIAFAGWKTDLDNKTSNNDMRQPPEMIAGVDPSDYWHPYNDPASWQHINSFTIGFGLNNPKKININPGPDSKIKDYLKSNWLWSLKTSWAKSYNYFLDDRGDSPVQDLANAALASRGQFYDVQTHENMIEAFNDIIKKTEPSQENPTVTGSSGVVGDSQQRGGSIFTTRYDIKDGLGSLMRKRIYDGNPKNITGCFTNTPVDKQTTGEVCDTEVWNAAKQLKNNSRHIFSLKRTNGEKELTSKNDSELTVDKLKYKSIDFTVDSLSKFQKARLIDNFPEVLKDNFKTDEDRLENLVNYVKGSDDHEDKFRNRSKHVYADGTEARNILGAIVRSRPVYAGVPQADVKHLGRDSTAYKNYLALVRDFTQNNTNAEKEILYVGANDGMLHAFKATTGEELFAYVPTSILSNLPQTVMSGRGITLVDGNILVKTVNFGSYEPIGDKNNDGKNDDWNRVLVGGFGGGAKGLYALNVTNPTKDGIKASTQAKWEYSDFESILYQKSKNIKNPKSNVGNILARPGIVQLHDNTWVAIVGNGYNSESKKAAVIVINLETGKPIQELVLPGDDSKENGLGPLSFIPYAGKPEGKRYLADRAYAGDLQGNLWVFDLEGSNKKDGIKVANATKLSDAKPLFTAVSADNKPQSITVEPLVVTHPLGYGNLVHFGTGSLFTREDESSKVKNTVYAIWDDWISKEHGGLITPRNNPVKDSQLNKVILVSKKMTFAGNSDVKSVRVIDKASTHNLEWMLDTGRHRGWRVDLEQGERAWQNPEALYGGLGVNAIVYRTANYRASGNNSDSNTGNVSCLSGKGDVRGSNLQFNMEDAGRPVGKNGVFDINKSGGFDSGDTNNGEAVTGYSTPGKISYNSVSGVVGSSGPNTGAGTGGNCKVMSVTTADSDGKQKTTKITVCSSFSSWQELK